MTKQIDFETWGAYFGISGAMLLAVAIPASKWGWVLFLASNLFWLLFALRFGYKKLANQTIVFTASSLLGILNSFWPGNPVQIWIQHTLQNTFA